MDESLRRLLAMLARALIVIAGIYMIVCVMLPPIARGLAEFLLNPVVIVLVWLFWFWRRKVRRQ